MLVYFHSRHHGDLMCYIVYRDINMSFSHGWWTNVFLRKCVCYTIIVFFYVTMGNNITSCCLKTGIGPSNWKPKHADISNTRCDIKMTVSKPVSKINFGGLITITDKILLLTKTWQQLIGTFNHSVSVMSQARLVLMVALVTEWH